MLKEELIKLVDNIIIEKCGHLLQMEWKVKRRTHISSWLATHLK